MKSHATKPRKIVPAHHLTMPLILIRQLFDRNSDLSLDVAGFEILVGGGGFSKRIDFGDGGNDFPALRQIAQNAEVFVVKLDPKAGKLFVRKFGSNRGSEHANHAGQSFFVHSRTSYPGQHADTAG